MAFLFSLFISFLYTIVFLYAWRRLPLSWLFLVSGLSPEERRRPHPQSGTLAGPASHFILFLFFFAVTLQLLKKVPLSDVFWGLSLFWFLAQIALTDYYYRLIPDQWSAGIALLGGIPFICEATACGGSLSSWTSHIPGLILCSAVFLFLYLLPQLLTGTPSLGLGDVKLISALAIVFPTREYFTVLGSAALLGGAVAAGMILSRWIRETPLDRGVPYGTVVAGAYLLSLFL